MHGVKNCHATSVSRMDSPSSTLRCLGIPMCRTGEHQDNTWFEGHVQPLEMTTLKPRQALQATSSLIQCKNVRMHTHRHPCMRALKHMHVYSDAQFVMSTVALVCARHAGNPSFFLVLLHLQRSICTKVDGLASGKHAPNRPCKAMPMEDRLCFASDALKIAESSPET